MHTKNYTYNSVVDGVHDSLGYMELLSQMKKKNINLSITIFSKIYSNKSY